MRTKNRFIAVPIVVLLGASASAAQAAETLKIQGSDSMKAIIESLASAFARENPDGPTINVLGGGSGGGLKALADGKTDLASTSVPIPDRYRKAIEQNTTKQVETTLAAYSALGVVVHKDNPVEKLTVEDIRQIWGADGLITKWSKLPKGGDGAIVPLSRPRGGGSFASVWQYVAKGAKLRKGLKEVASSSATIRAVAADPNAIGIATLRGEPKGARVVPLAKAKGDEAHPPSLEAIAAGQYPLSRQLLLHSAGKPEGAAKKFIDWLGSDSAKQALSKSGMQPGVTK